MKEQGSVSERVHIELGELVGKSGLSQIYFIGDDHASFKSGLEKSGYSGQQMIASDFTEEMGRHLERSITKGDVILVKGSRGAKTERFIPFCHPLNWTAK